MNRPRSVVVDASVILAYLQGEEGAEALEDAPSPVISTVNLAEVASKMAEYGMPPDQLRAVIARFAVDVIPFDEDQAYLVGELRPRTRDQGLSVGDRACLALARQRRCPALTTESAWTKAKSGVKVRLVR